MSNEPRRLLRPPAVPILELPDETPLTQFGRVSASGEPVHRGAPRDGEQGLSLIVGAVDAYAASILVTQHVAEGPEVVRHTRVGLLRGAGFVVEHDPTDWNGIHALVQVPEGAVKWDNGQKNAFKRTFKTYGEEVGDGNRG